jgi:hypothetical protein
MFDGFFDYFGLTGGVLIIIGAGLVLFLLVAVILEHRTKLLFPQRGQSEADDDFLSFDEDEEDES